MGVLKCVHNFNWKKVNKFRDLGVNMKIILKCILKELGVSVWTGFN
jgi:hypothetical protein